MGSQTTLYDGIKIWNSLSSEARCVLNTSMTVTRRLPESIWKAYLVQEHPLLNNICDVTPTHLWQMLAAIPGQKGTLNKDGSLDYSLTLHPLRRSKLAKEIAFANAILGPSFSYEAPTYTLNNGQTITPSLRGELESVAELHSEEVQWQTGDVALIDNWRVMHGRREILDKANRQLFIGMGTL